MKLAFRLEIYDRYRNKPLNISTRIVIDETLLIRYPEFKRFKNKAMKITRINWSRVELGHKIWVKRNALDNYCLFKKLT